ncbi:hypothetical protein KAF25_010370 [Fusarium avenaceum]|uniref:RNase III domain-containing protein n=1 Tax=Fusarium avenaceum TaxID=40199 RepID=A0A9P7H1S9_9HYPO|nr:hypothetical protein KAF25_010370 [Fusarium avenaceum]
MDFQNRFGLKVLQCEAIIGYTFKSKLLCAEALNAAADPQAVYTMDGLFKKMPKNDRLAIYGDAAAACHLYCWTTLRHQLLGNDNLGGVGMRFGLDACINANGGTTRITFGMVATALEAVLGAVERDGGHDALASVMDHLGLTSHALLSSVRNDDGDQKELHGEGMEPYSLVRTWRNLDKTERKDSLNSHSFDKAFERGINSFKLTKLSQLIASMFKQRSHDTHHGTHLPQIEGLPGQYEIALLGDSLFERFKTTGKNLSINQNPQILNLGVGGDKVTNVQYRINQGLVKSLKQHQPNLKMIYIHMGCNDMKKAGLRKQEAEMSNNLITEVRTNYPDIPIVITALFIQRGLANSIIDDANDALKTIAVENRCEFLPFGENQDGIMSEDNVHLNEFGYTRWNEILENDMKSR